MEIQLPIVVYLQGLFLQKKACRLGSYSLLKFERKIDTRVLTSECWEGIFESRDVTKIEHSLKS